MEVTVFFSWRSPKVTRNSPDLVLIHQQILIKCIGSSSLTRDHDMFIYLICFLYTSTQLFYLNLCFINKHFNFLFQISRYKKKEESRQMYLHRDMYLSSSHTLKHLIDQSSGSGSGLPLLVSIDLKIIIWLSFNTSII